MITRVNHEVYEAHCDRCGQTHETDAAGREHARRRFIYHGWRDGDAKRNEELICPDCVALEKEQEHAH